MLNAKTAQIIVDKTMSIIGVNVNIMDENAVIIASGRPERIGHYHGGAHHVLKTGRMCRSTSRDLERVEGVQPGITLPIFFRGKIVGTVGMTGEPDEVIKYGELVRHTTELMLEQSHLKEEIYLTDRARETFLYDLLTGHYGEDEAYVISRARAFGYDLRRAFLVISLRPLLEESSNEAEDTRQIVYYHHLNEHITRNTRHLHRYPDVISCLAGREIALLIPSARGSALFEKRDEQLALTEQLLNIAAERAGGARVVAGIGGSSDDWRELWRVYDKARDAIRLGEIYNGGKQIHLFADYVTEHTLIRIPEQTRAAFCESILGKLMRCKPNQRDMFLETLDTYFKFNMSLIKAAEALYIHRNTLMARLKKIHKLTGCPPQHFLGAFRLRMAMLIMRCRQPGRKEDCHAQDS